MLINDHSPNRLKIIFQQTLSNQHQRPNLPDQFRNVRCHNSPDTFLADLSVFMGQDIF